MKYSDNKPKNKHVERDPTLIIYCDEWCEYLQELVNLLHKKQQSFSFFDLRFDSLKEKELISDLGNPLFLPVLSFDGIYHERPPISKVEDILTLYHWRKEVDKRYFDTIPSEVD